MALTVVYTPRAEKALNDLDPPDRQRIRRRINAYAADPDGAGHDVVRLVDYVPPLRLRVGDCRVLFDRDSEIMDVQRILHRREAYR